LSFLATLIKRGAISIALALLLIILGLFSLKQISIRMFPKITKPIISITTTYPGASAKIVQGFITSRIENAITGMPNIDYITANNTKGASTVTVYLTPNASVDSAMMRLQEKMNEVKGDFPSQVRGPDIEEKANMNPSIILSFTSHQMSRVQAAEYLRRVVEPGMEVVNGVAQARVLGRQYALKIKLNPNWLEAYHLTASDVLSALQKQHVMAQAGNLEGKVTNLDINADASFKAPADFNNLVVSQSGNRVVRIRDIGNAAFTAEQDNINAFFDGNPGTMMFISLVSGANPLTVSKSILEQVAKIKTHLPYDLKVHVLLNASDFISASIREVVEALVIALFVITAVLLFFLGSFRAMLIPLMTIPVSLIGGLFLLYSAGYSINVFTLLAMVLAIGLVVDDAIVVVENIYRHIQAGERPFQAALNGTKEVYGAIIAMTLTLAAVFAPIFFMQGMTGKLFSEFAFALIASVLISGFIALSLTPMMASRMLVAQQHSRLAHFSERVMSWLDRIYQRALQFFIRRRAIPILVWLLTMVGCVYFYQTTPQELAPKEDQGFVFAMGQAPPSVNHSFVLHYIPQLSSIFGATPGRLHTVIVQGLQGENSFIAFDTLKPWGQRKLTAMQVVPIIQKGLFQVPGLKAFVMVPDFLNGSDNGGLQFVITSTAGYKQLYEAEKAFQVAAMKSGLFVSVTDDLAYHQPELNVEMDRQAMQAQQVNAQDVSHALGLLTGDLESQQYNYSGRSYDVIITMDKAFRRNPDMLNRIHVRNAQGDLVPLSALVKSHVDVKPASLNEFQKQNSVTIQGILAPGVPLSKAIAFAQHVAPTVLPKNMTYDFSGSTRQYRQEGGHFLVTFCLALLIIFLILGIQFNSFRDSLLILFGSVPMALCCALVSLKCGFGTINIYTQIALLTLVGLIAKHGVLMAKFANQLQEHEGVSQMEAIIQAAKVRFRPILMTSVAMVLGAMPLVFAQGAGSVSRSQMGLTLAFGLSLGTLCTIFVFPALYSFFSKVKKQEDAHV